LILGARHEDAEGKSNHQNFGCFSQGSKPQLEAYDDIILLRMWWGICSLSQNRVSP
jgi:hypothetical protein